MSQAPARPAVHEHYDAVAENYHAQYDPNSSTEYPANYLRLQLLLRSFARKGLRRVVEVGVGSGDPLKAMAGMGLDVWGFDISQKMVDKSREVAHGLGMDPEHIFRGDIQDAVTCSPVLRDGPFDGLVAMGVMPHVTNDDLVLANMASMVRPGGSVFVEFRNQLFSLFTFNRYTAEFILDDLLAGVGPEVKQAVARELEPRLRMDLPPGRDRVASGEPGYDAILSRFHNPLTVPYLFARHGFRDIQLLWYHYHAAPPMLEGALGEAFRSASLGLEHEPSGWRGMFLCSAFVVEAVRA